MPASDGERRARAHQRRQTWLVAQGQRHVIAVAQIANRGDPGAQRDARVGPRPFLQLVVGEPDNLLLQRALTIENEVLVRVDEAGQQRDVAKVHHVVALGGRDEATTLDADHGVPRERLAVEEPSRTQDHHGLLLDPNRLLWATTDGLFGLRSQILARCLVEHVEIVVVIETEQFWSSLFTKTVALTQVVFDNDAHGGDLTKVTLDIDVDN